MSNIVLKKSSFESPFLMNLFVKLFRASSRDQIGMTLDCGGFCRKWFPAIKEKGGCFNSISKVSERGNFRSYRSRINGHYVAGSHSWNQKELKRRD